MLDISHLNSVYVVVVVVVVVVVIVVWTGVLLEGSEDLPARGLSR